MSSHDYRSSQESLPLSQETYQTLVNGLFEMGNGAGFENATDFTRRIDDSFLSEKLELSQLHYAPQFPVKQSSLPPVSDWSGEFDFKVFFDEKEPLSKKVNWTYSATHNRLYVKKGSFCPINFATNCPMGEGYYIRAMLVYSEPQHSAEVVKRCINHSMREIETGVYEAEHLIRSGSSEAFYNKNEVTERHSVCVPFEDPTAGQDFTSYLYQFACFNSCTGGPNRRQTTIVFTLEKMSHVNTVVVGRKCFSLKVCACPGRDRSSDEVRGTESEQLEVPSGPPPKKKFKENNVVSSNVLSTKSNTSCKKPGEYTIKVKDEESYKFLIEMKKVSNLETRRFLLHMRNCYGLYRLSKDHQNFVPILNAYINCVSSNSEEERT